MILFMLDSNIVVRLWTWTWSKGLWDY